MTSPTHELDRVHVGIDVSKRTLDVRLLPEGRGLRRHQRPRGHRRVGRSTLQKRAPRSWSSWRPPVVTSVWPPRPSPPPGSPWRWSTRARPGISPRPSGASPRPTRSTPRSLPVSPRAVEPSPSVLPEQEAQALQAILARRRQLFSCSSPRTTACRWLPKPSPSASGRTSKWLEKELQRTDRDLDEAIEESALSPNEALLRSVPGVGPVLARTLLAELPELGTITHKRLSCPGGRRSLQPRLRKEEGQAGGVGREGSGEGDPVHGCPGRHPPQPHPQGVLRAALGRRQAQEGGLGGVHEEAALDPQRPDEGSC